jgi:glycosyltransferase involved in cell wall biosynthesis
LRILYAGFVDISGNKGDAVHARELVANLRKLGNRVIVVAHSSSRRSDPDFYNTGAYERSRTMLSRLLMFLVSYLRAAGTLLVLCPRCDVLYMRSYFSCGLAFVPKLLYSKRVVWEVNGIGTQELAQKHGPHVVLALPLIRILKLIAALTADRIVPVSPTIMDYLIGQGARASKMVLIRNGVNVEIFARAVGESEIEKEKRALGIPSSIPVLCYVGALRPWQGLDTVLAAAPLVREGFGEVRFLIVGGGEGLKVLMEEVRAKGLLSAFTITGSVPYEKVPLMLAMSDICLAPFVKGRAASPMKVFEYMAAGKPFVCSRLAGLEFIEEKHLGTLVAPGEPGELASAIISLLRNPASAADVALRAQDYAIRNCAWSAVARKVMSLCEELALD